MNEINIKGEHNTKNESLNFETIKKIILLFYPREDKNFIELLFQEKDALSFFIDLQNYFKNIPTFSNEDPENKFYGVQNFTKLPNPKNQTTSIELNKLNTDLIFIIVKEIMLSSYEEENNNNKNEVLLDKKNLIKSRLIQIFNCENISSIGLLSNKSENYTSSYPVNFYAFCISMKILLICFPSQIKNFHIGIFNTENAKFNTQNYDYFFSELFCSYLSFLYLIASMLKNEVIELNLHFFDDSNIYENFTFHIATNGFKFLKKILKNCDKLDILSLLNGYFNDMIKRVSLYFHHNNIDMYYFNEIIKFINFPGISKKIDIYCDKKIINNKNINFLKDLENCRELNIHIINTNSLIETNDEIKINLKGEKFFKKKFFRWRRIIYIWMISQTILAQLKI